MNTNKSKQNKQQQNKKSQKKQSNQSKKMVVYIHPRGIPFPARYRTSHRIAIQGNIVAASVPAVYTCYGSSMYLPLTGGGWPGVLTSSIATLMPAGFRNLCSSTGPYNNYRVFGSSARIRMIAGALTDIVTYTLSPYTGGSPPPTGVPDALAEPRTVANRTQGGGGLSEIKHHAKVSDVYGVTASSIQNDIAGIFSGTYNSSPTQFLAWAVAWTTSNGGTLGAAMSYEFEMLLDMEYFNLLTGSLLDT